MLNSRPFLNCIWFDKVFSAFEMSPSKAPRLLTSQTTQQVAAEWFLHALMYF